MKRKSAICLLLTIFLIIVTGCSSSHKPISTIIPTDNTTVAETTTIETTEPPTTAPKAGDIWLYEDDEITLWFHDVEKSAIADYIVLIMENKTDYNISAMIGMYNTGIALNGWTYTEALSSDTITAHSKGYIKIIVDEVPEYVESISGSVRVYDGSKNSSTGHNCDFNVSIEDPGQIMGDEVSDVVDNTTETMETTEKKPYKIENADTHYLSIIEDNAGLFSEEEKEEVTEYMLPITEYCNVLLLTTDRNSNSLENYAWEHGSAFFDTDGSFTVFLIDMDNRQIYIGSTADIRKKLTTTRAHNITDNIYKYASNGDYAGCARAAFEQMYDIIK